MPTTFMEKLAAKAEGGGRLCVGLDPLPARIPAEVSVTDFCRRIVVSSGPFAACFKPNVAFFEDRVGGQDELLNVLAHIRSLDPSMPVIGDMKRGDIGLTMDAYMRAAFDVYGFDAVTVSPYLGGESLKGALVREDKGIIILCRTSNPGAGEFQDLICKWPADDPCSLAEWAPLYQIVAHRVSQHWNDNGNCGLVVGATYPDELAIVHQIAPGVFKLIPAVGTQGGDLVASVRAAYNPEALPDFVINVSSAVLYAYEKGPFQTDPAQFDQAAAKAAADFDRQIRGAVASIKAG